MKLKKIFFFYIFFALIILILINLIILRPFPFFKVYYTDDIDNFNVSPLEKHEFYRIDVNKILINKKIRIKLDKKKNQNIYEKIQFATELTRSIQEVGVGTEIKLDNNILLSDEKFLEICSEGSKIFVSIMSYLEEYSRIIWANGHTVNEVWDGNKWILVDTLSNIYAYNYEKNDFLSFVDTVKLFPNVDFISITNKSYELYDYRQDENKINNILKKNYLIFTMPNNQIYSFHLANHKMKRIIYSLNINTPFIAHQFIGLKNSKRVGNVGINIYRYLY